MTNEFFNNIKEEYIQSIRYRYLQLLAHEEFSVNLVYCTSAKIKLECLNLFENEILNITDTKIVKNFLDIRFKEVILAKDILAAQTTKFRTITYFLKEGRNTSEKTADMAAFLIDFSPRPFHSYYKSKLPHRSKICSSYLEDEDITTDTPKRLQSTHIEEISKKENSIIQDSKTELRTVDKSKLKEDLLLLLSNSKTINSINDNNALSVLRDMLLDHDQNLKDSAETEVPMMIEYPNGVRVVLKTSDVSFISKLLMLK